MEKEREATGEREKRIFVYLDRGGATSLIEREKPYKAKLLTCHFRASLKHKDDSQTKFIKPNSQRQDIIKYWVSIGSIHTEQG